MSRCDSHAIVLIDSPARPLPVPRGLRLSSEVVRLPVDGWNALLTPWEAPPLFRGEPPFGGRAQETLHRMEDAVPAGTRAAVCGYSLGGLFALWALLSSPHLSAAASLSGSLWYPDWVPWLRDHGRDLSDRGAFLSLGTKEAHGPRPAMRTVASATEETAYLLRGLGARTELKGFPGGHTHAMGERLAWGLTQLDRFLSGRGTDGAPS
ncbi:alpha/beta hydrolase-fold protein [Atopobiaceae bacterium 24-176]